MIIKERFNKVVFIEADITDKDGIRNELIKSKIIKYNKISDKIERIINFVNNKIFDKIFDIMIRGMEEEDKEYNLEVRR